MGKTAEEEVGRTGIRWRSTGSISGSIVPPPEVASPRNGSRFAGIFEQPAWRAPGRRARLWAAAARWAAPAPNRRRAGRPVMALDRITGDTGYEPEYNVERGFGEYIEWLRHNAQ